MSTKKYQEEELILIDIDKSNIERPQRAGATIWVDLKIFKKFKQKYSGKRGKLNYSEAIELFMRKNLEND